MRSLALVCLLAVPVPAFAAPLTGVGFQFNNTYANLEFGPALGFARIEGLVFGEAGMDFLDGPPGRFLITRGVLRLSTGPLIDVTPANDGDAVYTYAGGGLVSVEFDVALPGGGTHAGTFEAPLGPYVIYPDSVHGGGDTSGMMGPGLFDRRTARLLGINRHSAGGFAEFELDTADDYPEPYRVARAYGGWEIVARVPEPSTFALGVLGLGFLFARRRALP